MRIVVAPQEFKGSLTAIEAASAIASGVRAALSDVSIVEVPMSDGGPGLVDALLAAKGGQRIETLVHGPLMRPVRAAWGLLADRTAAIEMAAASGLVLLRQEERDALRATTFGTGELIAAALDHGCTKIIVGVGGSATVDAGAGAITALGARLRDASTADLPLGGAALLRLDRIYLNRLDARVRAAEIVVATDVTSPLCGPAGAAMLFGPQKGASPDDVHVLDAALRRFAEVVLRDFGFDLQSMPGSGAAGGLGAGLVVAAGARIEAGFPLVAEAVALEEKIAAADIVITGEGRLDEQTPYGKTAAGVARMARARGKRVIAIAGTIDPSFDASSGLFDAAVAATPKGMTVEEAMRSARSLVSAASERVATDFVRQ